MQRWKRACLAVATTAAVVLGVGLSAAPAQASTQPIHIVGTGGIGVKLRAGPSTAYAQVGGLPEGASPDYICYARGQNLGGTNVWFKVSWRGVVGYYTSLYDDVPLAKQSNLEGWYHIPQCGTGADINQTPAQNATVAPAPTVYDRASAVTWALAHARDYQDPRYPGCTWFVSQALWYGGMHQTAQWNGYGFHGNPLRGMPGTPAATAVRVLYDYLVNTGQATVTQLGAKEFRNNAVPNARVGDLIAYDWEPDKDLGFDHFAIITNIAPGQYPEVSEWGTAWPRVAYTMRGWTWSANSNAWLQRVYPGVRAALVHLNY
jgi:hypothetical protein